MRALTLLLCLALAACSGRVGGPGADASAATTAPAASGAPAAPAAASAPAAAPAPARSGQPDSLTIQDARVECWSQVEKQRNLRSIDARIAFVDKCVADALKRP